MYILASKIEIGAFTFNQVNDVQIVKSTEDLCDTAVIKMPTKFKIKASGEQKYIEESIKAGDKVKITLMYEDKYEGVEFTGYVAKISPKIPLEIYCEDAIWLLRRKNINKSFGKTNLKAILQEVVLGTEIQLSDKIPSVSLDKWIIKNANGAQVLQKIKEELAMSVYIDDDDKLYAGLEQLNNIGKTAIYDLNYNLVENNLEFKSAEEKKIKVKYSYIGKDNKEKKIEIGDEGGELREFKTQTVSDEATMQKMAESALKSAKYDGYEGNVKSFLIPFATRGYAAEIRDKEHLNREGKYFIKKVTVDFGMSGARRTAEISNKL